MPIRVDDFAKYEKSYADQLNSQIEQVAGSLMHLDKLMVAGLVDRRVLLSFREAVDRVRTTGWLVQQAITKSTDEKEITDIVLSERVRAASRVLVHLAAELESRQNGAPIEGKQELIANANRILNALKE